MANCSRRTAPPRQPEERQEYRKSLHKSSSPHWKGAYRERCKKRLRASREKFLTRFRHITSESGEDPDQETSLPESPLAAGNRMPSQSAIASSVREVMIEEWEHVRMEYGNLPQIPSPKRPKVAAISNCTPPMVASGNTTSTRDDFLSEEELECDVELVMSIMDELTEELIKEEQALLAQYEEEVRFNEESLCDAVQSLSTEDVICPICHKEYLHQNKNIIFCSCGVRLDVAHDGISLSYMRKQLDHYSLEHSSQCRDKPHFSLECVVHMQTLIMNCPSCGFMEIII